MARPTSGPLESYQRTERAELLQGRLLRHRLPRFLGCGTSWGLARASVCPGVLASWVPSTKEGSGWHRHWHQHWHQHQLPAPNHCFPRAGDMEDEGTPSAREGGCPAPGVAPPRGSTRGWEGAGCRHSSDTAEMTLPLSQPAGEPPFPKALLFLAALP